MRATLLILAVFLGGCEKTAPRTRLNITEPDTRPSFDLDETKPFTVELGRGSGWHGLDVVKVTETGSVELHRIAADASVEKASVRLSASDVKKVVALVNKHRLTDLAKCYTDPNLVDGTQWVLWIQQGPSEKAVYFNNYFPSEINAFAASLDALLERAGSGAASWAPDANGRSDEMALWARIEPARSK